MANREHETAPMPSTSTAQMAAMNAPSEVAQLQVTVSALAEQISWFVARLAEDDVGNDVGVIHEVEESNPVTTPEGDVYSASLASTSSTHTTDGAGGHPGGAGGHDRRSRWTSWRGWRPRQTGPVDVLAGLEATTDGAGGRPGGAGGHDRRGRWTSWRGWRTSWRGWRRFTTPVSKLHQTSMGN